MSLEKISKSSFLGFSAVIAGILLTAFFPVLNNGFVNWDGGATLLQNFHFRGLGWAEWQWPWLHTHVGEYHPFAWHLLSLQYFFWGLDPGKYHAVSLAWHVVTTVMLGMCVLRLVRRAHPDWYESHTSTVQAATAVVVLAFQAHPLRTEVVAWASIQSYLPSTFFFLLAVYFYLDETTDANVRATKVLLCYLVSLLFKVSSVALPLALVLLDYYPLREVKNPRTFLRSLLEKIPLFAVSFLFSSLAILAKREWGAFEVIGGGGLWTRFAQSAYGVAFFPLKTFVPLGLRAVYTLPLGQSFLTPMFLLCLFFVVAVTGVVVSFRERWPGVFVSWLAYIVLLFPNLGFLRANSALTSDRYGYLPLMVFLPAVVLGISRLAVRREGEKFPWQMMLASLAVLIPLVVLSHRQAGHWQSTVTLWRKVIAEGDMAPEARNNLGSALMEEGKVNEAYNLFVEAISLRPTYVGALDNLGLYYLHRGLFREATAQFESALQVVPRNPKVLGHYAISLLEDGKTDEGIAALDAAIEISPTDPDVIAYRGVVLARMKRYDEAAAHFTEVLKYRPGDRDAERNLSAVRKAVMGDEDPQS